jgi:hypothetical protein
MDLRKYAEMNKCTSMYPCWFGFVPTNLEPVKANLEYWEKIGMTSAKRLADSAQCGGYTRHTGFRPETIKAAQGADSGR